MRPLCRSPQDPANHRPEHALAYEGVHLDIVQDRRIVAAFTMFVGDQSLSTSLATTEIEPLSDACLRPTPGPVGALLRCAQHTVYLDGADGDAARRVGVADLLEALGAGLDSH